MNMEITKLDNKGRGIGFYNNKITFIKNALPGEDVEIKITKEEKKYNEAEVVSINKKSSNRIIPKCSYYDKCGGCNLMHLNTDEMENFKATKVADILKKYSGIDKDVKLIKSDYQLFYRNKITLKIENGIIGYYNNSTHELCPVKECLLANSYINDYLNNNIVHFNNGELIIRCNYNHELLIIANTLDKVIIDENINSNIKGIIVNDEVVYGDNYFYDMIGDFKFKVSYNSFFQINNYVASRIFEILNLNLKGVNLLDLYCGVGTLGISLKNNFDNIYGIEIIRNAIIDAKLNANHNGVKNAHFFSGSTDEVLNNIKVDFDTVIVDPPRSGLNKKTLDDILRINPKQIGYVSCDVLTLARDLNVLKEFYNVVKVFALDMFPNTYHVETVCILERR